MRLVKGHQGKRTVTQLCSRAGDQLGRASDFPKLCILRPRAYQTCPESAGAAGSRWAGLRVQVLGSIATFCLGKCTFQGQEHDAPSLDFFGFSLCFFFNGPHSNLTASLSKPSLAQGTASSKPPPLDGLEI